MNDQETPPSWWPYTSGVTTDHTQVTCPASRQGNKCLDCRKCWDRGTKRVIYGKHWWPITIQNIIKKWEDLEERKRPSLQALKLQGASPQALNQGVKLQTRVVQFQDQGSRVQAEVSKLLWTGNKDKGIFFMSYMKWNLVRREPHRVCFCML